MVCLKEGVSGKPTGFDIFATICLMQLSNTIDWFIISKIIFGELCKSPFGVVICHSVSSQTEAINALAIYHF